MTLPARFAHAHAMLHLEDLPFWLGLARATRGDILELGCGTGRILGSLAAENAGDSRLVLGLDNDPALLGVLHRQNPEIPLILADMRAYGLAHAFGLIIIPCNTLSMFRQPDRRLILESAARHLDDQGVFAASLPNPTLWRSLQSSGESELEDAFNIPETGEDVQVSSAWRKENEWLNVAWHYDLMLPDGQVRRQTLQVRHSLASVAELRSDFIAAGLRIREEYGDFDKSAYGPHSPYWIVLAGREAP